jgi:hypothetical protein
MTLVRLVDSSILTRPNNNQDSDRSGKDVSIGTPRPYVIVAEDATGTTDITSSEIVCLGRLLLKGGWWNEN